MNRVKKELTRMRTLVLILVVALIGAIAFAVINNNNKTALPDLATYSVRTTDVERIVAADGVLSGTQTRSVYYPTGAKLTKLNVKVGDKVNHNDVLAKVEQKGTFGTTTSEVKSPIRGRVTAVNYFVDDNVNNPSLAGIILVDDAQYNIETYINENDIIYLKRGQTAEIVFPSISLKDAYSAVVNKVDVTPTVGSGAVDYKVSLRLKEKPKGIKLGMSANVEILTQKVEDVIGIPENYLIDRDDKYFVKKLVWENKEEGKYNVQEIEIKLGLITDELVEVKEGLNNNDELLEPSFVAQRTLGILRSGN